MSLALQEPADSGEPGPSALASLRSSVAAYYTRKVSTFGATPLGVDWPSTPALELRLVQLLKVCDFSSPFTLNDLGCGYAAVLDLVARRHGGAAVDYAGVDLSPAMIEHARNRWASRPATVFAVGYGCSRKADYSIASGIFNVKLNHPGELWTTHVRCALVDLDRNSSKGFAVNFMLPQAASVPQLYGSPPDPWVHFCRHELGRSVELVQGYGLPEYSLLAR